MTVAQLGRRVLPAGAIIHSFIHPSSLIPLSFFPIVTSSIRLPPSQIPCEPVWLVATANDSVVVVDFLPPLSSTVGS